MFRHSHYWICLGQCRRLNSELVTKPLIFEDDNLVIHFSIAAAGNVCLEIQDTRGNPLPGFALEESLLI